MIAFKFTRFLKALKLRRFISTSCIRKNEYFDYNVDEILNKDSDYNEVADEYLQLGKPHNCYIIQPYVKWGPEKSKISPDEQLSEGIALIKTLPNWTIENTTLVPLDTLKRKTLFKSGNLEKLSNEMRRNSNITSVFINISFLKKSQLQTCTESFQKLIFDRYNIVMQILKIHATSKHAKLQVALAELHYLRRKTQKSLLFHTKSVEDLRLIFDEREQKIKSAIKDLRGQRALLRNKRSKMDFPIVAVVGYTNAGKTSLIKSLTGEEALKPKNQLFATLDVTMHGGMLPSGLQVLYADTVGFMMDIPTNLIECFVATLEDAVLADVILHVEDISSEYHQYKRDFVLKTLQNLSQSMDYQMDIKDKVISVGNKCDLVKNLDNLDVIPVSAKNNLGLDDLRFALETFLLKVTNRKKMTIKVPNGGDEIRWLYKNAVVLSEEADKDDGQFVFAKVIISDVRLEQFKRYFIQ